MNSFLAFLRKLAGIELTIERVVSRQAKVVRDLDKLEAINSERARVAEEKAKRAFDKAASARQEALDAAELSANWKSSGLVLPKRKMDLSKA